MQVHAHALAHESDIFVLQSHLLFESRFAGQADLAASSENAVPRQSTGRSERPNYLSRSTGKTGCGRDLAVSGNLSFRDLQDDGANFREHALSIIEERKM